MPVLTVPPQVLRARTGFHAWLAWYDGLADWQPYGKRNPAVRPNVPANIKLKCPTWFPRRAAWWAARKAAQNPPPKPADLLSFWRSKGGWVAQGIGEGAFQDLQVLVRLAHSRNLSWVGIENRPANRARASEITKVLHDGGLGVVVWEWTVPLAGARRTISDWGNPDAYVTNVEGLGDYNELCDGLRHDHPTKPFGVFTNLWGAGSTPKGYSVEAAAPFVRNSFACITESYMVNEKGPQPSLAPERLDYSARKCGYPETFPCWGIYRVGPGFYDQYLTAWPHSSWYLMENLPAV